MIEKCNSTHARNHRKLRQAHIKKMVRNEDRSTQRFRTARGIRPRFFFFFLGFGAIAAHGPKTRKSESGSDPFQENIVRKVYTEKIGNLRTTTKFTTTWAVDWEKTGTRTSVSAGKRKLKMQSVGRSTTTTLNVNTNEKLWCSFATKFFAVASFKTTQGRNF